MHDPCVQLSTAVPDAATGDRIAADLLDRRLAACIQLVGPVRSHYRWEGGRQCDDEWLCLAKTRAALTDDATTAIAALHPYDEPEVIATPIVGGSPGYLAWIVAETTSP